jgi:hypothetical protein
VPILNIGTPDRFFVGATVASGPGERVFAVRKADITDDDWPIRPIVRGDFAMALL